MTIAALAIAPMARRIRPDQPRSAGLEKAIRAAGGVTELARRLGIKQPSVSRWTEVPLGRVLAVEAATGVAREDLRPDVFKRAVRPD